MIKELKELAICLNNMGSIKEANYLNSLIRKYAKFEWSVPTLNDIRAAIITASSDYFEADCGMRPIVGSIKTEYISDFDRALVISALPVNKLVSGAGLAGHFLDDEFKYALGKEISKVFKNHGLKDYMSKNNLCLDLRISPESAIQSFSLAPLPSPIPRELEDEEKLTEEEQRLEDQRLMAEEEAAKKEFEAAERERERIRKENPCDLASDNGRNRVFITIEVSPCGAI